MQYFYMRVRQRSGYSLGWCVGLLLGLLGWAGTAQAQAPTWQQALSGNANQPALTGTSQAKASALDANGNVFVTGSFTGQITLGTTLLTSIGGSDMFLAKWDATAGTWAWAVNGGDYANDYGTSVAVSGTSIYVTGTFNMSYRNGATFAGTSLNSAGGADIFLAKYTDNGTSASNGWAVRAGTTQDDASNAVAATSAGVFITGYFLSATASDKLTIAGVTLTSQGSSDIFLAKYVDNGTSAGNGWAVQAGGSGTEYGTALAVSGRNVYLTGYFYGATLTLAGTTINNADPTPTYPKSDIFLAKYVDNGLTAGNGWAVSAGGTGYDSAFGLAVSGTSVYVTGAAGNGDRTVIAGTTLPGGSAYTAAFVAKYTDNGPTATGIWATSQPTTGFYSTGYAVAVGGGAVYITGYFNGTSTIGGASLTALDDTPDTFVAKYLDNGTTVANGWGASSGGGKYANNYGAAAYSTDGGYGVVVSGSRVYVATATGGGNNKFGPTLVSSANAAVLGQLDTGGGTWQRIDAPLQGGTSQSEATATDASGNVFVAGSFSGNVAFGNTVLASQGATDFYLAKWNTATSTWAWAVSGGGTGYDQAVAVAVGPGGVYLTGNFTDTALLAGNTLTSTGSYDVFVLKYTDNGSSATAGWAVSSGGTGLDQPTGLAVSGNNVYATGSFITGSARFAGTTLTAAGGQDLFLVKYFDNGASVGNGWAVSGGGASPDQATGIATNGNNVYLSGLFSGTASIAGTTLTSAGDYDIFMAKYVDNGTSATNGWALRDGGADYDRANGIALNGNNVYLAGSFTGTAGIAGTTLTGAGNNDIFVAKYVDNGATASDGWAVRGGGTGYDSANDLAVNGATVYVTGTYTSSSTIAGTTLTSAGESDLFVARYLDGGTSVRNGLAMGGGGTGYDAALGIAASGRNAFVVGLVRPRATFGSNVLANPAATSINFLGRLAEPAPTISSFTPTSGYEGVNLTLYGSNLTTTSQVSFSGSANSTVSADFTVNTSGTAISGIIVPAGAITGPITVTTAGGTATSAGSFTVTAAVPNPVPTITALSPAPVSAGSGAFTLSISGTSFVARCVVKINGVAMPTTFYSATQVVAAVPASAVATAGSYPVTVTNPTPAGGTSNALALAVTVPQGPTITSFTPASGAVGATISLLGTDLARTSVITFTGNTTNTVSSGFTVNATGTQITGIVVPIGAQTGPLRVTTPLGTGSSAASFMVTNAGTPSISSFTPASAPAGTTVAATGTNLSSITALTLNGAAVPLASLKASTNTGFSFVVPAGATATGTTTVATAAGAGSGAAFRVTLRAVSGTPVFNGNRGAVANSFVAATFSEPVTGTAGMVVYSAQAGGRKPGTVSATSTNVSFTATPGTPNSSFKPGETIQVTLPSTTRTATNIVASKQVYQFTTAVGGAGRGTFVGGSNPTVAAASTAITTGDVDGDGDLDLLTGSTTGNVVSLLRNAGNGTFGAATSITVGTGTTDLALADVDGDGDLDLLASNYTDNTVSVRTNSGTGTFGGTQTIAMPANTGPEQLVLGDVDGDGDLDLLVGTGTNLSYAVTLRLNGGDATGSNTGIFSGGQNISVGGESQGVALADVDGDGDLDVLAASITNSVVQIRLNGGDATGSNTGVFSGSGFVSVGSIGTPASIAMGDIDGDGDLDLLTANYGNSNVSVCFNNGKGDFINYTANVTVPVGSGPYNIALADVDADGDLDFLTANSGYGTGSNAVTVGLNGGDATGSNTGVFKVSAPVAVGEYPRALTVGDLDGDGDLDFATPGGTSGQVSVRLNGGTTLATAAGASAPAAFSLYPNPASRAATVAGLPGGQRLELLDAVGRLVATATADATGKALLTWPASVASGVYVLRAGTQARRLTIE